MISGKRKGYGVADYAALQHMTMHEASVALGVSYASVRDVAARHKLRFRPARAQRSRADYEAVTHLTIREAAIALDVTEDAVRFAKKRYGITFRPAERAPVAPAPARKIARPVPVPPEPAALFGGPFWTPERDAEIRQAMGRLVRLSALADAWGVPVSRVMARWHVLRVAA